MKNFPSDSNHAQCFNHVIALVAKRLICQFDVSNKDNDAVINETERELRELAKGSDIDELLTRARQDVDDEQDEDTVCPWRITLILRQAHSDTLSGMSDCKVQPNQQPPNKLNYKMRGGQPFLKGSCWVISKRETLGNTQ
jgi:hypothetical protein